MKNRKGALQIDYIMAMGAFIVTFAFLLYYLTNYVSFTSSPRNEIMEKGIQVHTILFGSSGLPNDWEEGNKTVRVGLIKKLYRVPIYIYSNSTRQNWPVGAQIDFEGIPLKKSIILTNKTNSRLPIQIESVSEPVNVARIHFVTNLTEGRNVFYIYYSDHNTTDPNYSGMSLTSSNLDPDCAKRIDNGVLTFHLCRGNGTDKGSGIRSLVNNNQGTEIAVNKSIDQIYLGGDLFAGNDTHSFFKMYEGPIASKYKLVSENDNTTIETNFTFYNGTSIWKIDSIMTTSNSQNKTSIRMNTQDIFEKFQNHNTSEIDMPSTQMFNQTNYAVAIDSNTGYVLATAIISNVSFEVGWKNGLEPEIRSISTPSASQFTVWHSYQEGNITTAQDLFREINVTVLSKEEIDSIGFEKVNALADMSYDSAKSTLDMGLDHFFIDIENDTSEIFSYGKTQKKRDVYVESNKALMQRENGDIEFITYTLGVWR